MCDPVTVTASLIYGTAQAFKRPKMPNAPKLPSPPEEPDVAEVVLGDEKSRNPSRRKTSGLSRFQVPLGNTSPNKTGLNT